MGEGQNNSNGNANNLMEEIKETDNGDISARAVLPHPEPVKAISDDSEPQPD